MVIERLGLAVPVIQAPMAGVSTPAMAAAVSEAGALGSLGLGAGTVAQARAAIEATRALTARPFGANVFCHQPARRDPAVERAWLAHWAPLFAEFGAPPPAGLEEIYASYLADDAAFRMLLELRPAVVSFHFGLPPSAQVAALREAGIVTMATATTPEEARAIEAAGIDAVVAQGFEAGGHRGTFDPALPDERLSMAVLVRLVVRQTRLPVIAAGGIMDGAGIRAALDLGAAAAQLGTAFVACPESAANAAYRDALAGPRAATTRMTPVLSGRQARGMLNRMMDHGASGPAPADYPVAYDLAKRLHAAASAQGNHEFAAQWAGQGAPLSRAMPAAALVRTLAEELRASRQPAPEQLRAEHQ